MTRLLLLLIVIPHANCATLIRRPAQVACYPEPKPNVMQYMVGYGSLISTASKNRTDPNTTPSIPVKISGFERIWNVRGVAAGLSTTYLGILPTKHREEFNAVIFQLLDPNAVFNYDMRESFYCRKEVSTNSITLLPESEALPTDAQYWIYVTRPEFEAIPDKEYPIVQSYVDTFLNGCLEMESTFHVANYAEDCIRTTKHWSRHWVNDRIFPRRPFLYEPNAGSIDRLLAKTIPNEYQSYITSQKTSGAI